MLSNQLSRTELLIGSENIKRLRNSKIAVFGIGGVGSYAVEALARSGVGALELIDNDKISISNLNRQIIATRSTVGQYKVDAAKKRIEDIDPDIKVITHKTFYMPDTACEFDFSLYDYIVDAIDTVTGKLCLIEQAERAGVPIISSMGTGNKLNADDFQVCDIYETSVCPLAKVMRKELRSRGIKSLKVVYSKEIPINPAESERINGKQVPGSTAFVPSAAGLIIAGEVVKDLINR
ncbi:MAG: ThiF family adenylyltransferase [Anaerovoracaceae bacterium]